MCACVRARCLFDMCATCLLCVFAAYLLHAFRTKFLWFQLDVKGNPMSAGLHCRHGLVCVCVSARVCMCVCGHSGLATQLEQQH